MKRLEQPMLLNDASGGMAWKEHQVHIDQILERYKTYKLYKLYKLYN